MAWTPSGVDANWDPFGQGNWGYYTTVGYVWISGYSWGWWPYHCGAWNWFDGTEVHFRPAEYWQEGTKLNLRIATGGLPMGGDAYGDLVNVNH